MLLPAVPEVEELHLERDTLAVQLEVLAEQHAEQAKLGRAMQDQLIELKRCDMQAARRAYQGLH